MIEISKAKKTSDLTEIIRLIYETDDYIYPSMCGHDYGLFESVMQKFLLTDSIFSYNNILIACDDGTVVGMLLYIDKDSKLPNTTGSYLEVTDKQAMGFDSVISDYFLPLLSKIGEGCIYINNICVSEKARRRGISEKLIAYLSQVCSDKTIVLDCLEENTAAVRLYRKLEFKETERFLGFSGKQESPVSCIRFEKKG